MPRPKKTKRILITGGSGCVGHYLVEELARETKHELVLVLRNPSKLQLAPELMERVTMIEADVKDTGAYLDKLGHIDTAILAAACWGGPDAPVVNVDAKVAITRHLAAHGASRVFYFSSASVLDHDGSMLQAAHDLGTEYIRSKYDQVVAMEALDVDIERVGIFPTLVVGGEEGKPMSHFANLLKEAAPWAWAASFFRADGKFHYIHTRDIARTMRILVDAKEIPGSKPARIVLGNAATTVDQFVGDFVKYRGIWNPLSIKLRDSYARVFIKLFRVQMEAWDRYCMEHRDLSFHHPVNPAVLGEEAYCSDLRSALASIGLKGGR
ncbi:MAG: NAD(P)-dependent oxidoreductase [Brucellaceae bacterium]|nr:NAD(P)-dependent oxidoreductase [Brucellaceae bacterium]